MREILLELENQVMIYINWKSCRKLSICGRSSSDPVTVGETFLYYYSPGLSKPTPCEKINLEDEAWVRVFDWSLGEGFFET